jgi:hypothetical protein
VRLTNIVITALLLVACDDIYTTPDAGPVQEWSVVHVGLDEGLTSVWGRSSTDVYTVGSDTGDGPIVLHFDGDAWTRLATGASGDLWWVNGPSGEDATSEDPIFMGGVGGSILRYDGASFTPMTTPGTGTVYGIWAAAPDDVWAVGGVLSCEGFAWHYDGTEWAAVEVPDLGGQGLFIVWGNATDDVWMVGAGGTMLHWDGSTVERVEPGTTRTLFTIHVAGDRAAAVGGAGSAALVEREGGAFVDHSPAFVSQLYGVWLTEESGFAVGLNGTIRRRTPEGTWVEDTTELGFIPALHAVWADETGGVWAVGGQVVSEPLSDGAIVHRGVSPMPGGTILEGP